MKKVLIILVALFSLFFIACEKKDSKKEVKDNVTSVNNHDFKNAVIVIDGKPYYKDDILNFIFFNFPETSEINLNNDNLTHLYFDEFINLKLLYAEAKKNNVTLDNVKYEKIIKDIKKLNDKSFVINLPISFDEYKKLLKESLIVKEWLSKLIEENIIVTENDVKNMYKAFLKKYTPSVRYHVFHIVTLNYKDAKKARLELLRGKPFSEVAKKYSVGPEKDEGGDLGNITLDDMPKVFQNIKKLHINRISPIYKSDYGYHIFKVVKKIVNSKESFEVLKPRIYQELFTTKVDKFLNNHLKELRKNAKIKIFYTNLNIVDNDNSSKNN